MSNEDVVKEYDSTTLVFMCPACKQPHVIFHDREEGPKWTWNGDKKKPTFSPSLVVRRPYGDNDASICHSFIRDGKIEFLGDCTHGSAGQTMELKASDEI